MATSSRTEQETIQETTNTTQVEEQVASSPPVKIKLRKPKPKLTKKVSWTEETVDNEGLGRKKSKCCCVYEKPKNFGDSSESESEGECEHCSGHVEAKHKRPRSPPPPQPSDDIPNEADEDAEGDLPVMPSGSSGAQT